MLKLQASRERRRARRAAEMRRERARVEREGSVESLESGGETEGMGEKVKVGRSETLRNWWMGRRRALRREGTDLLRW
jgi:hypothetical protein